VPNSEMVSGICDATAAGLPSSRLRWADVRVAPTPSGAEFSAIAGGQRHGAGHRRSAVGRGLLDEADPQRFDGIELIAGQDRPHRVTPSGFAPEPQRGPS
jgi:hypothetical protein